MPRTPIARPVALLVTRNFPPLVGGMERVNQKLLESLAVEWEVLLSGPLGSAGHAPSAASAMESRIRPLPIFLLASAWKALRLAVARRPALVLAGSGLTAPIAWLAARLSGGRPGVYLHGLDIIAPSRVYQAFWLPFIRACRIVLVNSENTARLARAAGVAANRIAILHPGTSIPEPDPAARERFRSTHDLGARPVLLSVGRLTRRKGLAEFVERALPRIASARCDVLLAVIGDEASDALHGTRGSERQRILAAASVAGVAENIRFLGRLDEEGLHSAYFGADCHVFPVLDLPGDVEGFGMVALESAAHGLPTVAFNVGGVADAVAEGRTGHLVAAGDYEGLARAVDAVLSTPRGNAGEEACRRFAADKSWDRFGDRLRLLVRPESGDAA